MPFTKPKAAQIDFDITNITDPLIRLNSGESGSADKDVGIVIERGSDTNVALIFDESANEFVAINTSETGTTSGNVSISSYAPLQVSTFKSSGATMTGAIAMGTNKITGLGDPGANQDAATKAYVDSTVAGFGSLSNIVEDTSPQLGGALDLNSQNITGTGFIELTAGNTYDPAGGSGTDTSNNVGLALAGGGRVVFSTGGFIRNVISATASSTIEIGQSGTGFITGINLNPGTSGAVKLMHSTSEILTTASTGVSINGNTTITSTVDGGPILNLVSNDHSDAADFAQEGAIKFFFDNDANESTLGFMLYHASGDITDGTEDGWLYLNNTINGSNVGIAAFGAGNFYLLDDDAQIEWNKTRSTNFDVRLQTATPSADRTITLPDATGTVVLPDTTDTLTNKTLTNPTINAFSGTGNGSITGTLSIDNTTTGDSLLIETTEASSSAGPVITLKRHSGSPADADYLGRINFKGENDADQGVTYARISGKILDASDGTEDGIIEFANVKAGSNTITARLRSDSLQLLNSTGLTVAGTTTLSGNLALNAQADLQFYDSDSSNYVGFQAPATISSNVLWTLPNTDGTDGQIIKTDGAGTLSWTDNSGGGGSGSSFPNSTFTTCPASDGSDFDLSFNVAQTSQETPFEASGTDPFGVNLGSVYSLMDPVGQTLGPFDMGALT